jgi:hypothetical protein
MFCKKADESLVGIALFGDRSEPYLELAVFPSQDFVAMRFWYHFYRENYSGISLF